MAQSTLGDGSDLGRERPAAGYRWSQEYYKIVRVKYIQMYFKTITANLEARVDLCK